MIYLIGVNHLVQHNLSRIAREKRAWFQADVLGIIEIFDIMVLAEEFDGEGKRSGCKVKQRLNASRGTRKSCIGFVKLLPLKNKRGKFKNGIGTSVLLKQRHSRHDKL